MTDLEISDDLEMLRRRLNDRMNDYLRKKKESYDDTVTGFNEAWNVMRTAFNENTSTRIDSLEISVRTNNVLTNNMGLKTIQQLVECTPGELLRQPNFGRRSLNEITAVLRGLGLSLSDHKREAAE